MKRVFTALPVSLLLAGCSISQDMQVTRTAHYDAEGKLTGYSVSEAIFVRDVSRPSQDKLPEIKYFSVAKKDSNSSWPPAELAVAEAEAETEPGAETVTEE